MKNRNLVETRKLKNNVPVKSIHLLQKIVTENAHLACKKK